MYWVDMHWVRIAHKKWSCKEYLHDKQRAYSSECCIKVLEKDFNNEAMLDKEYDDC